MKNPSTVVAIVALCVVVGLGGFSIGRWVGNDSKAKTNRLALAATGPSGLALDCTDAQGNNPCAWVANYFAIGFWPNLAASSLFAKWKQSNPGEWSRLLAYAADATPWSPTAPAAASTKSFVGDFIRDAVSMCKVVGCGSQAAPVPSKVAADTTPPTPPTGLTATEQTTTGP